MLKRRICVVSYIFCCWLTSLHTLGVTDIIPMVKVQNVNWLLIMLHSRAVFDNIMLSLTLLNYILLN